MQHRPSRHPLSFALLAALLCLVGCTKQGQSRAEATSSAFPDAATSSGGAPDSSSPHSSGPSAEREVILFLQHGKAFPSRYLNAVLRDPVLETEYELAFGLPALDPPTTPELSTEVLHAVGVPAGRYGLLVSQPHYGLVLATEVEVGEPRHQQHVVTLPSDLPVISVTVHRADSQSVGALALRLRNADGSGFSDWARLYRFQLPPLGAAPNQAALRFHLLPGADGQVEFEIVVDDCAPVRVGARVPAVDIYAHTAACITVLLPDELAGRRMRIQVVGENLLMGKDSDWALAGPLRKPVTPGTPVPVPVIGDAPYRVFWDSSFPGPSKRAISDQVLSAEDVSVRSIELKVPHELLDN